MEVHVDALYDVLCWMLEGMYLKDQKPESYRPLIDDFRFLIYEKFPPEERERFREELSDGLKYYLNTPQADGNRLFYDAARHGLDSEAETRRLFGLIWAAFFGEQDWRDERYRAPNARIIEGVGASA